MLGLHSATFALKKREKSKISELFSPLGDTLVATFNETPAPTSGKYVAEQDIVMSHWLKTFQTFRWHSWIFALEKQPKNLNFLFLPLGDPLVPTFSETCALTSGKYVADKV